MRCVTQQVHNRRRGVSIALVVVTLVALLGMASLTVDVGFMYRARAELQSSADAAAMAAAWQLMDPTRLKGASYQTTVFTSARQAAAYYAGQNFVMRHSPEIDQNTGNSSNGDLVIGYMSDLTNPNESMNFASPSLYNSVKVRVRRDSTKNGVIDFLFAGVFGHSNASIQADATAMAKDGVTGWKVTPTSGNAGLLPFALHRNIWNQLMANTYSVGDTYSYNPANGTVSSGADGVRELNLYPGGGGTQLPPGNFGTVDIGSPNNSAADLSRQILQGVNASDLAYFGGELKLGSNGTVLLNGDTGLSAAVKDDLVSIIGQPRAIPIFSSVSGNGNNSMFTVVGFVGVRIMHVQLTGSMNSKHVIVQPAILVDDAALTSPGAGSSWGVYQPVQLVR